MIVTDEVIQWLLSGDPAICWQTRRDLLAAPVAEWQSDRQATLSAGWGAQLLARQDADGRWGSGIYSPKWTSTTYTLLMLLRIGIPGDCAAAQRGANLVIDELLGATLDAQFRRKLADLDRCIVGMVLQIAVYFGLDDERIEAIIDNLLAERMPDDGWNCRRHRRPAPHHSSFHTTLNVLDGLREYIEAGKTDQRGEVLAAEASALELLLQHYLFKSDKTGKVIEPRFTLLSFPPRWHYDALRGLEYFARSDAPGDERLQDAIGLLNQQRRPDGLWPLQYKYSGKVFFEMERVGQPSRWNTLRALRILRWWERAKPNCG